MTLTKEAEETFRHIPAVILSGLKTDMQRLSAGPPGMVDALKKADTSHPIFQDELWVLYAMREHARATLSRGEYSRLMLYDDCCKVEGFEVLQGYHGLQPFQEELFQSFQGDIPREKFDQFINSLDCHDQIFKICPLPAKSKKSLSEHLTTGI